MLNNYPRWYTFTPPQWHVFPPPLTSKERRILNSHDCLALYIRRGKAYCAVPSHIIESVFYNTTSVVPVPTYGSQWNLPIVLALEETCQVVAERRSNEFKSDVNAAIAYRLSKSTLPIFEMVLKEMNLCWVEPICKCSDIKSSGRCDECGRPYERPEETIATSIAAYEIGVRCAEQSFKSLLLLQDGELRRLPFEKQERVLKRWRHDLKVLWNQLNEDMQIRIQSMVKSDESSQLPIGVEGVLQEFTNRNFNKMRYLWRIELEGPAPNFAAKSEDDGADSASFSDLEKLYGLFSILTAVLRVIPEMLEESPFRESRVSVSAEPDYFQPKWEPPTFEAEDLR